MKRLPLEKLGARGASSHIVNFGVFLPWVSATHGNRLWVKVIHEKDQFLQHIPPLIFELRHSHDADYGDYWSTQIDLTLHPKPHPDAAWGAPGKYVYRYCLENQAISQPIDWIIDPFAREFGVGKLSAFTLGYEQHVWSSHENQWKTPPLSDLVLYELMIGEFGGDIDKTIARLDYLADLGVTGIELMPVSNVSNVVDWGFLPIGYFGVDERFGNRRDMQRLVDAAHQRGIAVILDSVYGHTSENFPYSYLYRELAYRENPFMGPFAKDYFGESTDFNRAFTRDFFFTVNHHWLDCYHIDGFRYDCVPNYWDGATGQGYAALTYETYRLLKEKRSTPGHWQRFFDQDKINLIQCAEQLEGPVEILEKTYSNCTWQNETLGAAQQSAHGNRNSFADLGLRLGLLGYPRETTMNGDILAKTALQYIENHDHSRFVCNFGTIARDNELLKEGDRNRWYKVQPYLIGLLTAPGVPLLWQGQEFGENYAVPQQGWGRVMMFRPVRWDYFYDPVGQATVSLVRTLLGLRGRQPQFRHGDHFFYGDHDYLSKNLMFFSRRQGNRYSLVALNFGDTAQTALFAFPLSGDYREELHGNDGLQGIAAGRPRPLTIPSNYGRIWSIDAAP
ncbi:MAG TPA: alpha-amlyase [Betaproteobacteria bacterium]|nr:alpha-amlyase [Betaproteobacteria bacterium]